VVKNCWPRRVFNGSNKGAEKPPDEWAQRIIDIARDNGTAVFVKDNYGFPERIKEFPNIN